MRIQVFTVDYDIFSGSDDDSEPVASGSHLVIANDEESAIEACIARVHAVDIFADPRIDPRVEAYVAEVADFDDFALGELDNAFAAEGALT